MHKIQLSFGANFWGVQYRLCSVEALKNFGNNADFTTILLFQDFGIESLVDELYLKLKEEGDNNGE